jgi:hypothetical protein
MRAIDQKLKDVDDAETLKLFKELQLLTGVSPEQYAEFSVYHFLQQCLYPHKPDKLEKLERKSIEKVDDYNAFVLLKKAGKVGNHLHRILREVCHGIDYDRGTSIYMMLNKYLILPKKKKKR